MSKIKSPKTDIRLDLKTRSSEKLCPIFSFEYMQKGYSVDDCEKKEKVALISRLYKLSQMSWESIAQAQRHGLGWEKIERYSFYKPIPDLITPDVRLIAFRFCGEAAMVGFRKDRIFHIVWLDRDFTLYRH